LKATSKTSPLTLSLSRRERGPIRSASPFESASPPEGGERGTRANLVLGHSQPPVVLLEEGTVVLLRHELEEAGDGFRRAELPAEALLVGLQEREERVVAELAMEGVEEQRALVVEK